MPVEDVGDGLGGLVEIVGRDDLLGEIAADIETADVAPQGQVLPRRKQLAKPRADEGVDPIDGA